LQLSLFILIFALFPPSDIHYYTYHREISWSNISVLFWQIDKNDNIVYSYQKNYEILIFDSEGKLVRKILKEYDPVEITNGEKEERMKIFPLISL